jgi:SNF2 family DNA or RNA helicase
MESSSSLKPGRPQSVQAERFKPAPTVTLEPERWRMGRATRLDVGWFDFDAADQIPVAASSPGAGEGDAAPPDPTELARRLAALLQPPLDDAAASEVLAWPAPLHPFQRDGALALMERDSLLLADSMGLGKTIQAIAALRILFARQDIGSALVVGPASLLTQWRRELSRWAPELRALTVSGGPSDRAHLWNVPAHVCLVSYETLRADVLDVRDSPVTRRMWDVVLLDEASRIRNRRSGVAVACKRVPRRRSWALTGTPLENSLEDVVSILDFLTPNATTGGAASVEDVRALLCSHQLRRRKQDVLKELPPRQVVDVELELLPAQREAYDRAEREGLLQLEGAGASVTILHVLELIVRLKQLCNADPASGQSSKLADMAERLRAISEDGQRALVFSQFTDSLFGIGRAAEALREFQPLVFTGAMSLAERARVVDTFIRNPTHRALLLSLRAGGQGLNLQAASYVFHMDRWWNPALEEQADSRAHRMGQTNPVTVYRYICVNTVEERIDALLRSKRALFQDVVEDSTLDLGAALTESELFGLFGFSRRD